MLKQLNENKNYVNQKEKINFQKIQAKKSLKKLQKNILKINKKS